MGRRREGENKNSGGVRGDKERGGNKRGGEGGKTKDKINFCRKKHWRRWNEGGSVGGDNWKQEIYENNMYS